MKSQIKIFLSVLLVSLLFGFSTSSVSIDYFKAKTISDRVILEWKSLSETDLINYQIERKRENQTGFESVKTITPSGSGSVYSFEDIGLYKTNGETISYRLNIKTVTGSYTMDVTADYKSTAVRRTWGSIKAMFK